MLLRLVFAGVLSFALAPSVTHASLFSTDNFSVYGDFRARFEVDWDSIRSSGAPRDDRSRLRIRARVGLNFDPSENFSFGIRLRTGSDDSHQSPHITVIDFNDNDTGDADANLDKWFLKAKKGGLWAWVGRNSLPFWKPNELFWDDDATPAGVALGHSFDLADAGTLKVTAGYLSLPVGMQEFSGNLRAVQTVFSTNLGDMDLTMAGGVFGFDADPDDPDAAMLLNGNGLRDYTIWVGNVEIKFRAGDLPVKLGFDFMHNSEDYSEDDPNPFTVANRGQTDGYVATAIVGQLKSKGDWLAGYYYAHIETLAVNSSYSQDDWMRWGSATETRSSNFKGHEFRIAYVLRKGMNLVARLYLVEAITTIEDGNRFRLDLNYKF